jgi:spore germination protein KC
MIRLGIFLLCITLLTGCWNRRELNELALVMAIGIDKVGDKYKITLQVVDPGEVAVGKKGGGSRSPVVTYSETDEHIFPAIRKLTKTAPRKMYFAHLQMFVISEDVAKEGISTVLEFLSRDHEVRKDFYITVAKNTSAENVLQNVTAIEKIPANKMHSSLKTSEAVWAPTVAVRLDELIAFLTSDGINAVLTGITYVGKNDKRKTLDNVKAIKPYGLLKYQNIAVFNEDKLVGWLDETESKGYNYIVEKVKNTVGPVPCSEKENETEELIIEIIRIKTDLKGKMKNGKPEIDVHLRAEANVAEAGCEIDLTKPETIKMLERTTNKRSKMILESAVKKAQELQTDIFGFGEEIHRVDPKAWKKLKKNWDEEFSNMQVNIRTEYTIRRSGTINRSFIEKTKEN